MTEREALKIALKGLNIADLRLDNRCHAVHLGIQAINEALAQPEQEPVAWLNRDSVDGLWYPNAFKTDNLEPSIPLYTTPPQRTWVGLTNDEMVALCQNGFGIDPVLDGNLRKYAQAIEAKLKEKNT